MNDAKNAIYMIEIVKTTATMALKLLSLKRVCVDENLF